MSWNGSFASMEGSSDRERQSWRDSFNNGRAAGDLTGNVNRQLDAERAAFQGATWSGSSSQPSALEVARSFTGYGVGNASAVTGAPVTGGPGQGSVTQGPSVNNGGPGAPGAKASSGWLQFLGAPPLTPKVKTNATGGFAGVSVEANPWFSNVEDYWEPRMGEPGEWLGGIVNIGADAVWNGMRFGNAMGERLGTAVFRLQESGGSVEPMAPMGAPASLNW